MSVESSQDLLSGPIGPIDIDDAEFDLGFVEEDVPKSSSSDSSLGEASLLLDVADGRMSAAEEQEFLNLLGEEDGIQASAPIAPNQQAKFEEEELMNMLDDADEAIVPAIDNGKSSMTAPLPAQQSEPAAPVSSSSNMNDMANWGEWDVPLGRAQEVREFVGNVRFRDLVEQHRHAYHSTARKPEKTAISTTIYNIIKSNGGRFLDKKKAGKDSMSKTIFEWYEIPQEKALAKISQALRLGTRPVRKYTAPSAMPEIAGYSNYAAYGYGHNSSPMPYYGYGEPSTLDMYSGNAAAYYQQQQQQQQHYPMDQQQQQQQHYPVDYTTTSVKLHSLSPPRPTNMTLSRSR